jgi:hypothetical protein
VEKYKEKRTTAVDDARSRPPSITKCDEVNGSRSGACPGKSRMSTDDIASQICISHGNDGCKKRNL